MFKCLKAVLAAALLFSVVNVSTASATGTITLDARQCATAKKALDAYIIWVNKNIKNAAQRAALIADAKASYEKACPSAPVVTRFECIVSNSQFTGSVSVGVADTGAALTNDASVAQKPACMSSSACLTIVSNKLFVQGTLQSTRCNPPDATVVPLTDVEVQTKVNAIP